MDRSELLELLDDLEHDLGKHMLLPLTMLPADAPPEQLRAALQQALLRTRTSPAGQRSARQLWQDFCAEAAAALTGQPGVEVLGQAVDRALAWQGALESAASLDRARILADLQAVRAAIRNLMQELDDGR